MSDWLPRLDPTRMTPLYEQIIEAVALALAAGELRPGDRLPSVRILAKELRMNPNTTARSLRELERAGLAQAVRGVGSVVPPGAVRRARALARRALGRELAEVVQVAKRLGMSLEALRNALQQTWEEDNSKC